jgi:hypothetical protein
MDRHPSIQKFESAEHRSRSALSGPSVAAAIALSDSRWPVLGLRRRSFLAADELLLHLGVALTPLAFANLS